jgi:hypothetical protein
LCSLANAFEHLLFAFGESVQVVDQVDQKKFRT